MFVLYMMTKTSVSIKILSITVWIVILHTWMCCSAKCYHKINYRISLLTFTQSLCLLIICAD